MLVRLFLITIAAPVLIFMASLTINHFASAQQQQPTTDLEDLWEIVFDMAEAGEYQYAVEVLHLIESQQQLSPNSEEIVDWNGRCRWRTGFPKLHKGRCDDWTVENWPGDCCDEGKVVAVYTGDGDWHADAASSIVSAAGVSVITTREVDAGAGMGKEEHDIDLACAGSEVFFFFSGSRSGARSLCRISSWRCSTQACDAEDELTH